MNRSDKGHSRNLTVFSKSLTSGVVRARMPLRLLSLGAAALTLSSASPPQSHSIGFVLTDLRYALYETPEGKEECPSGLQVAESEQFKRTPGFREHLARFGGSTQNRGPNGELGTFTPEAMIDPIPWRELETGKGFGFNLDGTQDGAATEKTCKHDKFTDPEGRKVDNQMARVVGCVLGWRTTGFMTEFYSKEVETSPYNRLLIEVRDVDSEENDPSVTVFIHKGRDRLVRAAATGTFIPFLSHRVDTRFPQFSYRTTGRIVDGVLMTDPIDFARMSMLQINVPTIRQMRDLSLRLKLNHDGAEGYLGGYEDLFSFWNTMGKGPGTEPGRFSPGQMYDAAHRYADGHPDPETGQCTAISATYKVKAVRAMIVNGGRAGQRVAAQ